VTLNPDNPKHIGEVISDLAPFPTGVFRRRKALPKNAFTVRALRARTVNAKGARSELSNLKAE
jgi:hypothetical protein